MNPPQWDIRQDGNYVLMAKWAIDDYWHDIAYFDSETTIQIVIKHLRREVEADYAG